MKNAKDEDNAISSFSWWQDSHSRPPQSPWLQATVSDLDEKTKVMVSIIDQNDGDSFARRAEMFYRRRPELVGTIHDVHRSYGCLAQRFKNLASPPRSIAENYNSSSSSSSSSVTVNGGNRLDYEVQASDSEEKKVKGKVGMEIADTRLRVLKLAENNLYEQADLIRTNNQNREALRLLSTRVHRLVDEHKDLHTLLRSHATPRQWETGRSGGPVLSVGVKPGSVQTLV